MVAWQCGKEFIDKGEVAGLYLVEADKHEDGKWLYVVPELATRLDAIWKHNDNFRYVGSRTIKNTIIKLKCNITPT